MSCLEIVGLLQTVKKVTSKEGKFTVANGTPDNWQPGDRILDLYEVRALLGEGGMGKVYKGLSS